VNPKKTRLSICRYAFKQLNFHQNSHNNRKETKSQRVQPAGKKMMDALAWARGLGSGLAEGKVVLS